MDVMTWQISSDRISYTNDDKASYVERVLAIVATIIFASKRQIYRKQVLFVIVVYIPLTCFDHWYLFILKRFNNVYYVWDTQIFCLKHKPNNKLCRNCID